MHSHPMTDGRRRFDGQVVVVTGAGQGLGRVMSLAFASEGAVVGLAARSTEAITAVAAEIDAAGGEAIAAPTDLASVEDVEALAATVHARMGPVDVLVCNAGVEGPTAPLWEIPVDEWEQTLRVNATGPFLCCRAFLDAMVERRRGSVLVIGSITSRRPLPGRGAYAASKSALSGLVRTLAVDLGPHDIRVNLISPGAIAGPRLDRAVARVSAARGVSPAEARTVLLGGAALGRAVDPEEVAATALFLASDAGAGITGEEISVSAGLLSL